MKILILGFLLFFGWSALSTRIYVCKIKGLCNELVTVQNNMVSLKDTMAGNSISQPLVKEKVVIPENMVIYFAFDKSEFQANSMTDKYYDESFKYLVQDTKASLSITGYTDAVGSDEYNQALGYRRAQSIHDYFESRGMTANKITIESKGEKEPADDNNTTSGRANNRRTAITIKN